MAFRLGRAKALVQLQTKREGRPARTIDRAVDRSGSQITSYGLTYDISLPADAPAGSARRDSGSSASVISPWA